MADYVPQVWADNDATKPLSAARMNAIETGIDRASVVTSSTTLPGSPFDGQDVWYAAAASNGVYWHLRYRSASASGSKWEFLGGSPLTAEVLTSETTTSTTYVDLATVGPSVTVPLAGDYLITVAFEATNAVAGNATAAVKLGAAATSDDEGGNVGFGAGFQTASRQFRRNGLAATAVLKVQYKQPAGNTCTFLRRNLSVQPVRVT